MQNFTMKPSRLLMVIATISVVACSRDRVNDPIANVKEAVQEPELQGKTFKASCTTKPVSAVLTKLLSGKSLKASQTQYKYVGANVTRSTSLYPNEKCDGEAAVTFEEWGSFNVNKNQKNEEGAAYLDMDFRHLKVKINNDIGTEVANDIELCDSKDWATGQERDVTPAADNVNCYNFEVPRVERTVYAVEGKVLILGSQDDKDQAGRSAKLDRAEEKYSE